MNPLALSKKGRIGEIKRIIAETLKVEVSDVKNTANFATDLGVDSIDLATIVIALEDFFDVDIDMSKASDFTNINDVDQFLVTHLSPA